MQMRETGAGSTSRRNSDVCLNEANVSLNYVTRRVFCCTRRWLSSAFTSFELRKVNARKKVNENASSIRACICRFRR